MPRFTVPLAGDAASPQTGSRHLRPFRWETFSILITRPRRKWEFSPEPTEPFHSLLAGFHFDHRRDVYDFGLREMIGDGAEMQTNLLEVTDRWTGERCISSTVSIGSRIAKRRTMCVCVFIRSTAFDWNCTLSNGTRLESWKTSLLCYPCTDCQSDTIANTKKNEIARNCQKCQLPTPTSQLRPTEVLENFFHFQLHSTAKVSGLQYTRRYKGWLSKEYAPIRLRPSFSTLCNVLDSIPTHFETKYTYVERCQVVFVVLWVLWSHCE